MRPKLFVGGLATAVLGCWCAVSGLAQSAPAVAASQPATTQPVLTMSAREMLDQLVAAHIAMVAREPQRTESARTSLLAALQQLATRDAAIPAAISEALVKRLSAAETPSTALPLLLGALEAYGNDAAVFVLQRAIERAPTWEIFEAARRALIVNSSPVAGVTLLAALQAELDRLPQVPAVRRPAVAARAAALFDALAARGDAGVKPLALRQLAAEDEALAVAAVRAAGVTATLPDLEELLTALDRAVAADAGSPRVTAAAEAVLQAAGRLRNAGQFEPAVRACRRLTDATLSLPVRSAAWGALLALLGDEGLAELRPILAGQSDPALWEDALRLAAVIPGDEAGKLLRGLLDTLTGERRLKLIEALGPRIDDPARDAVALLLSADDVATRHAAILGLGNASDAEAVELLLDVATASNPLDLDALRSALRRMPGREPVMAMLRALPTAEGPRRVEIFKALGSRGDPSVFPLVLQATSGPEEPEPAYLLELAGEIGPLGSLPRMLDALFSAEDDLMMTMSSDAIVRLMERIAPPERRAEIVLDIARRVRNQRSIDTQVAFVHVLGRLGGDAALAYFAEVNRTARGYVQVQDAVIQELSRWRDPAAIDALLAVLEGDHAPAQRLAAAEGLARLGPLLAMSDPEAARQALERGLRAAQSADERHALLPGVARVAGAEQSVQGLLDAVDRSNVTAKLTHTKIIESTTLRIADSDRDAARSFLARAATGVDVSDRERIHQQIERIDAHLCNWEFSGPYALAGQSLNTPWQERFAPEPNSPDPVGLLPWRVARLAPMLEAGAIHLGPDALLRTPGRVVYGRATIDRPAAGPVRLTIGCSGPFKLWLGRTLLAQREADPLSENERVTVEAELPQGRSELLIKLLVNETAPQFSVLVSPQSPDAAPVVRSGEGSN